MTAEVPATMAAWQSGAPGIAGLGRTTLPVPRPRPDELLVRVDAAALNFSDLLMLDDAYQVRPARPFVPGQEIAGTVVATGTEARLAAGTRVAGKVVWGGFAEYALMRADMAIPMPEGIDPATAAALPISYTTAMVALTEATAVAPGETVLVLAAAGGVGLASVEIAARRGACVIAAAGGPEKGALARRHGAAEAIDYHNERWSERVKALTEGRGVDVVVDPVGGAATREALRAIAWNGRLLVVGFSSGEIPQIAANRLLLRRAAAIGVYWSHDRDGPMLRRVSEALGGLLRAGALHPHVGARHGFGDLPAALADLAGRRTTGKAVLDLGARDDGP